MLDDPAGIDAHVIGNHVAGQPDAVGEGAVAQVAIGRFPAQILGYVIAIERVGRSDSVVVAAELLDGLRGGASFPHADEPERVDAVPGQAAQLFVGNLVQAIDVAAVVAGELLQPDVGALGDEHGGGHPFLVGAEALGFLGRFNVGRHFSLLVDHSRGSCPCGRHWRRED